jgi:hypothetical protein
MLNLPGDVNPKQSLPATNRDSSPCFPLDVSPVTCEGGLPPIVAGQLSYLSMKLGQVPLRIVKRSGGSPRGTNAEGGKVEPVLGTPLTAPHRRPANFV